MKESQEPRGEISAKQTLQKPPEGPSTPIELPPLPFAVDALEPYISAETINYHYGKHHANYVMKTNDLLSNHPLRGQPLEAIIRNSKGSLFNNAAQVWNHTFFWNCLTPANNNQPEGILKEVLEKNFESVENFKTQFAKKANDLFGSGWVWLVRSDDGKLKIQSFSNAGNPLLKTAQPLLTLDVWEHAYYIDYRNDRKRFIEDFWNIVNWEFVASNLGAH